MLKPTALALLFSRTLAISALALAAVLPASGTAATVFSQVATYNTTPAPAGIGIDGLAEVGGQWFASNLASGWNVYNAAMVQTGTTNIAGLGNGMTRGLAYDAALGRVYVANIYSGAILTTNTSGAVQQSFTTGIQSLVGLALNASGSSLWALGYLGQVNQYNTSNWQLQNSFTVASAVTSVAYDSIRDTLLFMESGLDRLYEYTTTGGSLGQAISTDMVAGNGLGLYFQSLTGNLYATSQTGQISVWNRDTPIANLNANLNASKAPEPSTIGLLAVALTGLLLGARRRLALRRAAPRGA